jgi:4-hydroxybenzoate polyprenyltransferase
MRRPPTAGNRARGNIAPLDFAPALGDGRAVERENDIVPDSERRGLIGALPGPLRPYASLIRLDRPVGAWLLFWPGAWALALAGLGRHGLILILWLGLGAWAMRGAGCVYNDLVDRDLDRKVERTRQRPLASGRVSPAGAWALIAILCLIGLVVLLQLNRTAQITALVSLAPVALYPFMKRISLWPQAWLGLVFSWAALVGWAAAAGTIGATALLLYAGSLAWVVGYDTIYALQDKEDDRAAGIGSSALALGPRAKMGIAICYAVAILLWAAALWRVRPDGLSLVALAPMALHLLWQAGGLKAEDGDDALARFRSNRFAGLLMFLACLVVGTS